MLMSEFLNVLSQNLGAMDVDGRLGTEQVPNPIVEVRILVELLWPETETVLGLGQSILEMEVVPGHTP